METAINRERAAGGDPVLEPAAPGVQDSGRTLTAIFENEVDAERAIAALRAAGMTEARVRLAGPAVGDGSTAKGFWEQLTGFLLPAEDESLFEEGLRHGHALLTVSGYPAAQELRLIGILEAEGAVDLEDRSSIWREQQKTSGESVAYAPGGTAGMTGTDVAPEVTEPGHEPGGTAGMTGYSAGDGAVPSVAEVSRRDRSLPGVRVRAYYR